MVEQFAYYNYKGLESIANSILKIKDYNQLAISLIRTSETLKSHLLKHFPKALN